MNFEDMIFNDENEEDTDNNNVDTTKNNVDDFSDFENEIESSDSEIRNPKKVAIISVIAGVVVISLALAIGNIGNKMKASNSSSSEKTESKEVAVTPAVKNSNSSSSNNTTNDWVLIDGISDMQISGEKESDFTVISIKNYAKVQNGNGDKVIRSIANGYVGGLVGTYEIEIPYDKAVNVKAGTQLKVSYNYAIRNEAMIITSLKFI
jgi:hypothetical protein